MTAPAKLAPVALVCSLLVLPLLLLLAIPACPSHDETRKPDGEGPAEEETGQPAEPEPKPSV